MPGLLKQIVESFRSHSLERQPRLRHRIRKQRSSAGTTSDPLETRQLLTIDLVSTVAPELVSVTGNSSSNSPVFSANGTKVAFSSFASNLVSDDTNAANDIFVKNLSTGVVTLVSTDSNGLQANGPSYNPALSADGTKIAFSSYASNLVVGDTNETSDIFLKDLTTGAIIRVSTDSNGVQGNNQSDIPVLSADGTKVAFRSIASNLVNGDTNVTYDIFVKDLLTGATTRVSTDANGVQGNGSSSGPRLSADGTKVTFESSASNLVSGDTDTLDVFLKDMTTGVITRVSTDSSGIQANNQSFNATMSADGTKVAFASSASNLVSGDTNNTNDIFVKNLSNGAITRVSTDSIGTQGNGDSRQPMFSSDGTKVVFYSAASNFVSGDTNGMSDIFLKDLSTGVITRVSTNSNGLQGNNTSAEPSLSADGTKIAFYSTASNLVGGDTNNTADVFFNDLSTGTTQAVSVAAVPQLGGNNTSDRSVLSADGTLVAFDSTANNLVSGDTNGVSDIFTKNLSTGVLTRVSTDSNGVQATADSFWPSVSADGTIIAFYGIATNLVSGDTNGVSDIFVKNLTTGVITRASTDANGVQGNSNSVTPSLSADGTKVAFRSSASNLVSGDTNGTNDVFVKDLSTGLITRVSTDSNGNQANGGSGEPVLSADGTRIAFSSTASNLVSGDSNDTTDIFVKDLTSGVTRLVSTDSKGSLGNGSAGRAVLSAEGTKVAFHSSANNLVSGDTNGATDTFLKDLLTGVTYRVSTDSIGAQGNSHSTNPALSADGTKVVFNSLASNFVSGDANGTYDVFMKDLTSGVVTLVSVNAVGVQGNSHSLSPSLSTDGMKVVFASDSTNLHPNDLLSQRDIFLVTDDTPPVVSNSSFLASGTIVAGSTSLTVSFSETVLNANNAANYELRRAGADGLLGSGDDPIVAITSVTYAGSTNTATLNFAGLAEDVYRLTVNDSITDAFANALDGDQNGTPGGYWRKDFVVGLPDNASSKTLLPTGRHGQATGRFGYAVAADATYRVVGAPFADSTSNTDVGYAYVYDAVTGALKATLRNPTPANGDIFGYSVAVSGNLVAVGAYDDDTTGVDSGSVYLFNAANGVLLATIANPTPAAGDAFGSTVGISGNLVVVSASGDDSGGADSGTAYVFNATTGALLATLANPTPGAGDNFGSSVGISGNTVVVGASGDDSTGGDSGSAYLFNATTGALIATLANPTPAGNDQFGFSVAISGNFAVVGAFLDNTGAKDTGSAYVFNATSGALMNSLANPTPTAGDNFGFSVSVSGNTVAVGALSDDIGGEDSGKAYLFNATSGALIATLAKPTPVSFDELGLSVAISGTSVLVGAPYEDTLEDASGSVFIFDSTTGALSSTLTNPISTGSELTGNAFGYSVAEDGNYRVVGAPFADFGSTADSGFAYVYDSTTGALLYPLSNPTPAAGDFFGYNVAISGNKIVVGAFQDDVGATDSGVVYIFDAATGALLTTIANPTPAASDYFGYRIAISGNAVVVGAYQDDTTGTDSGSAYVFDATTGALIATLANPTPAAGDNFGNAVAVSGNVVVVAAYLDDTGAADSGMAYAFNATTGQLISTLANPAPGAGDGFGKSIAISGDLVVVGAFDDDTTGGNSGSSYVFSASLGSLLRTLANPTPVADDEFGISVAISGTTIVVGAHADDTTGTDSGSAYAFNSSTGALIATLSNPSPATTDIFGFSVAVSANSILVGAYLDDESGINSGAAYVFNPTTGALQAEISNPMTAAGESFGNSIAAAGDFVVVGAHSDDTRAQDGGAAYIYNAKTGSLISKISNPSPVAGDLFGYSVAASGNRLAIGAIKDDTGALDTGAVYVFDLTTGALISSILNPNPGTSDYFGSSVAIDGNILVIGANADDAGTTDSGSAYVFNLTTGALIATLLNPTPASGDSFGSTVSISGNTVAVAAPFDDTSAADSGSVYLFNASTGALISTIANPTPAAGDAFGTSVAISGNTVAVGADSDDAGATNSGSAYLFNSTTGTLTATLINPSAADSDRFGTSVAISGDTVVVAALLDGTAVFRGGSAYVFNATTGQLTSTLLNPSPVANDYFGYCVAVSGNSIAIGAPLDDSANADEGAVYLFTAETYRPLVGPVGHSFNIAGASRGAGQLIQGSDNAFDGLDRLQVSGDDFVPPVSSTSRLDDGSRTIVTPVVSMSGLSVSREVTVPGTGAQDFARTLDVFSNPTGTAITVPVRLIGNLGSDAATTVFATSDGDTIIEPTDWWFGTDDGDGVGAPAIIHLLHAGFFGSLPTSVAITDDNVDWTFKVTVNAGDTTRLATFTVLGDTRADAIAAVNALVNSNGFTGEAAAFLSAGELATIANFQFNQAPTDIQLNSTSITENAGANALVATITTVDPNLGVGDSHTYTLVSGTGSTDNGSFSIVGNQLRANSSFDFETKNSYSIRIQTTDAAGTTFEKSFTIVVTDVDDTPPVVTNTTFLNSGTLSSGATSLQVMFSEPVAVSLGSQQRPARSAWEIRQADPTAADGIYWIDPDGAGVIAPFQVYCDMATDGGGWMLAVNSVLGSEPVSNDIVSNTGTVGLGTAQTRNLDSYFAGSATAEVRHDIDGSNVGLGRFHGKYRADSYQTPFTGMTSLLAGHTNLALLQGSFNSPFAGNPGGASWFYSGNQSTTTPASPALGSPGPLFLQTGQILNSYRIWIRSTVTGGGGANGAELISNYELRRAGADGLLGNSDDPIIPITSVTYATGINTATLNFAGLVEDVYRLTVKDTILDPAGNALDGDANGTAAGFWRKDFVAVGVQGEILTNGSFENGFAGWITSTISTGGTGTPYATWAILSAGQSNGMHGATPQDGSKIASNGFDGGGPMQFTMYQDVAIPAGVIANLSWKDRIDWNMTSNGALTPRLYQVQVRNPGTNSVSGILHQFSTGSNPVRSAGDTNWQSHSVDVSAYAGSTVRVFFYENIPESYTGPAQIDFDAVSLKISSQMQLNSSGNFLFDVLRSSAGPGEFLHGTQGVFDGLNRLIVNGTKYTPVGTSTTSNGGRTLQTPNSTQTGLTVHREVTIPNTGSEDFGRTIDVFTNPTGVPITVPVRIVGNLGSDAATTVFATSDGDLLVEPTDLWFATDDDNPTGGTPAIVHLLHGPFGLQPTSVNVIEDNIEWTYNLTVGPGDSKRLASFTILGTTRQRAIDSVNALIPTSGFGGQAAAFLTNAELSSLANFQFNQAPTDVLISNSSIPENAGTNAVIGTLSFTDPNAGDSGVFSLPPGIGNNNLFNIAADGVTLRANSSFNYESLNLYSVTVRVTDAGGLSFDKTLSISVTNVNEAPTDISLSATSIAENLPSGTVVGTLSTADPDAGSTFTYALLAIPGSSDDASFTIVGNALKTATSFNFEAKPSYTIRIQSTDQGGLSKIKDFIVTVTNITELGGIDVQLGQTQRSHVRYLDVLFDRPDDILSMINTGRINLSKMDLNGLSPAGVPLTAAMFSRVGNSARIDFGANGLGGDRNSNAGDGYYELGVDMDGNGTFESKKYFHRLLGDLTGNGIVDSADKAQFLGRTGATAAENDVNGDGLFNLTDSSLLSRAIGRKLKGDLFRDD